MGLFNPKKERLTWDLIHDINNLREGLRKMQSSFFKWCPVTEQEAPGTN